MSTGADLLKRVPLFAGLSETQRERIANTCRRRTYRSREHIFFQGDPGSLMYIVVRGGVKIYNNSEDGTQETTLALLGPSDFFGEMALLTTGERTASAVTIADDTELLILDQVTFYSDLRESFELTRALLQNLANRLKTANENLVALASDSSLSRVAKLLLMRADLKTGQLSPPLSQEEIANLVGVRRETIARNLAKLEAGGALKRNRGNIVILDRAHLERVAQTA